MLAGDDRCDSPGHNAKYGTYSVMEVTTEKIVDFFPCAGVGSCKLQRYGEGGADEVP